MRKKRKYLLPPVTDRAVVTSVTTVQIGPEQRKTLVNALLSGLNVSDSCELAKVSRKWFYQQIADDTEFGERIKTARYRLKQKLLLRMQNRNTQQADQWLAEHVFRDEFAPMIQLAGKGGGAIQFEPKEKAPFDWSVVPFEELVAGAKATLTVIQSIKASEEPKKLNGGNGTGNGNGNSAPLLP